jgi:hypothetical protein
MVTQYVPLLTLPADLDTALRDWFGRQVNWCRSSPQGEKARNYGNNITIWYHAIVSLVHSVVITPAVLSQVNDITTLQNSPNKRICAVSSLIIGRITSILPRRRGIYRLFPHHVRIPSTAISLPSILLCSRTLANQTTALHPVHP